MTDLAMWMADCAFEVRGAEDGRAYERVYTIHYAAPATSMLGAVAEAMAWVGNRQRHMEFGRLLALKVYAFEPQVIGPDGQYSSPTGILCYEWKCDHGKSLPQRPEA